MNVPVLEKTVKDLVKKKTFVFVILLQLFLVLALGMVLANISILFEPSKILIHPLPIGVVGDTQFAAQINEDPLLHVIAFDSVDSAAHAFNGGTIDAYLVLDSESIPNLADITLPSGDIRASILVSLLQPHLEKHEDILRRTIAPQKNAFYISSFRMPSSSKGAAAKIFEIFYAIVLPFFLLLPGILLSSMLIDIVVEDIDKNTIALVLMRISPQRYIAELGLGVIPFSVFHSVIWMILLALRRVTMLNPESIMWIVFLATCVMFLLSAVVTLLFPHKTKAQLVFSFLLIFLFSSIGLTEFHPLRLITGYSLNTPMPSIAVVSLVYLAVIGGLTLLVNYLSHRLRT